MPTVGQERHGSASLLEQIEQMARERHRRLTWCPTNDMAIKLMIQLRPLVTSQREVLPQLDSRDGLIEPGEASHHSSVPWRNEGA